MTQLTPVASVKITMFLSERGPSVTLGHAQNAARPTPMGKMFVNTLAIFAEFEVDLLRLRAQEGMAMARAKRKFRGRQPKLSARQQAELCRMHASGDYSIADLAELLFSISPRWSTAPSSAPHPEHRYARSLRARPPTWHLGVASGVALGSVPLTPLLNKEFPSLRGGSAPTSALTVD